jgi:copper chaperone CopZ
MATLSPWGKVAPMVETTLRVTGMSCGNCVEHVAQALRQVPGVAAVDVALAEQRARVTHDPARAPVPALIAAIEAAGYEAGAPTGS